MGNIQSRDGKGRERQDNGVLSLSPFLLSPRRSRFTGQEISLLK